MLCGLDTVSEAQTGAQVLEYEAGREELAEMDIAVVLVADDLVAGSFALEADDHAGLKFHRWRHLLHFHPSHHHRLHLRHLHPRRHCSAPGLPSF